jgi:hypothetical protein
MAPRCACLDVRRQGLVVWEGLMFPVVFSGRIR